MDKDSEVKYCRFETGTGHGGNNLLREQRGAKTLLLTDLTLLYAFKDTLEFWPDMVGILTVGHTPLDRILCNLELDRLACPRADKANEENTVSLHDAVIWNGGGAGIDVPERSLTLSIIPIVETRKVLHMGGFHAKFHEELEGKVAEAIERVQTEVARLELKE